MSEISASLVKELRERTGMGMMDCKQALVTATWDISLAIEELRKSSGIKASKKAGRSAVDGVIIVEINNSKAFMVEINCETDFVAKNDSYRDLANQFAEIDRPSKCEVEYLDYNGNKQNLKAEGLLATCIQHEIDHLEGILFIDYLSKLKKEMIIKKLSKQQSKPDRIIV